MGKCKENNCIYKAQLGSGKGTCCYYIAITGYRRGCPPDNCDKYKAARGKRKKKNICVQKYI